MVLKPISWCCVPLLLLVPVLPENISGTDVKPVRRVLILNEVNTSFPGIRIIDDGIRTAFDNSPYKLEVYREYLDTIYFPDESDQQRFRGFYIQKYHDHKPDVIVTVGPSPLKFMSEMHQAAFPGVPIVFCLPHWVPGETLVVGQDFTGVENDLAALETVEAAVHLQRGTKHVVVVGGTAFVDIQFEKVMKKQLSLLNDDLDISYLTSLAMPDLLERLKRMPSQTIVLFASFSRDAAGTKFISGAEAEPMIVAAANAPVFSLTDAYMNHGEVGGKLSYLHEQGRIAGDIVLRILGGEKPQDIPRSKAGTTYIFDSRALKRWGFRESDLPPGSIVLNRQPTTWELYEWYIVGAVSLLFVQTSLIVGLLWHRARRRKVELALGESEEKFSKAFRQSPFAITIVRARDGRYVEVNETFELQTGWKRDEVIGRSPLDLNLWVDPDQRTAFLNQVSANGNVKDLELRFRRKDGQIRTALGSAELIEVHSEPCALSVIADITERKQAEEAISGFSRRLIEAQETERTRIARELHDDINQRLAMVAISLKTAKEGLPNSEGKTGRLLEEAGARVSELESDVQALSHQLHSSKLDYLGLESAISGFCSELSERQNVKVDFRSEGVPEDLSSEVSLCLFRVLQEAVHNALKYSGVYEFEVSLIGTSNAIELRVHDSGAGFDAKRISNGHGLGLTSMKERLKLVSGDLRIDSEPGHGTTVLARVPLVEERSTAGAAA